MKVAFMGKICTDKSYISKQLADIHNCKIFSFPPFIFFMDIFKIFLYNC